jgi:hypothetical protein
MTHLLKKSCKPHQVLGVTSFVTLPILSVVEQPLSLINVSIMLPLLAPSESRGIWSSSCPPGLATRRGASCNIAISFCDQEDTWRLAHPSKNCLVV